ncbi:MAG: FAD-dependent oxidoreductase [Pseudomonadota bacterium]|nr:FAD-dependent oxidoreductase [Pseudomonadota bacterium]
MQEAPNLVIGFGKAGKTLAAALAQRGEAVTLIERSPDMFGGTCINVACIPTKALIHGAETGTPYPPAWAAKNTVVDTLREKNRAALLSHPQVSLIVGEARFIDAHTVAVQGPSGEEQRLRAARIFINTGTVPAVPPIEGVADSKRCFTSTTLMALPERPARLVIVGGGFIGIEFASMMACFGSQVTLLEGGPAFLPREDEDVAAALRQQLERAGVRIVTGARTTHVQDVNGAAQVDYEADGSTHQLRADAVLLATGRVPTTAALDLPAAGIATDARGFIQVNDQLQTSQPHIWALGDINGGPQFTFISLDDQRIVLNQLTGGAYTSRAERPQWATCVFTTPPLAHIGLREREARARGIDFRVAKLPAAAVPKARILGQTEGFLKALVDAKTGQIIGCTLLCPEAHEVINTVQVAINAGLPASTLRTAIYTHPSMTEALNDLFAGV